MAELVTVPPDVNTDDFDEEIVALEKDIILCMGGCGYYEYRMNRSLSPLMTKITQNLIFPVSYRSYRNKISSCIYGVPLNENKLSRVRQAERFAIY